MPGDSSTYVFGRNPVKEAIRSGKPVERVLIMEESGPGVGDVIKLAKANNIQIKEVKRYWLDERSMGAVHQGVAAQIASMGYVEVEDILARAAELNEEPFIVLVDGITDPHNLGAILRSAECFGAHGLIVPKNRNVGLTPSAVKASAGAASYIPVARVTNLTETIKALKEAGLWICGADMEGQAYEKAPLTGPVGIVVGGEDHGINLLVKKQCDFLVGIPQYGKIGSLNASVAAGILLCEVAKRRHRG